MKNPKQNKQEQHRKLSHWVDTQLIEHFESYVVFGIVAGTTDVVINSRVTNTEHAKVLNRVMQDSEVEE